MMPSSILMAVVTAVCEVVGYGLAFGGNGPFVGDLPLVLPDSVGNAPNADCAPTIMFAIVTSALISGVFAERMKFRAILLFMVLWA